jgi:hypothetical protein
VKSQQMQQLLVQFINYVSALTTPLDTTRPPQYSIDCFSIERLSEGTKERSLKMAM